MSVARLGALGDPNVLPFDWIAPRQRDAPLFYIDRSVRIAKLENGSQGDSDTLLARILARIFRHTDTYSKPPTSLGDGDFRWPGEASGIATAPLSMPSIAESSSSLFMRRFWPGSRRAFFWALSAFAADWLDSLLCVLR